MDDKKNGLWATLADAQSHTEWQVQQDSQNRNFTKATIDFLKDRPGKIFSCAEIAHAMTPDAADQKAQTQKVYKCLKRSQKSTPQLKKITKKRTLLRAGMPRVLFTWNGGNNAV